MEYKNEIIEKSSDLAAYYFNEAYKELSIEARKSVLEALDDVHLALCQKTWEIRKGIYGEEGYDYYNDLTLFESFALALYNNIASDLGMDSYNEMDRKRREEHNRKHPEDLPI